MITSFLTLIGETAWGVRAIAKTVGLAIAALIALAIVIAVLGAAFRFAFYGNASMQAIAPMMARGGAMGYAPAAEYDMSMDTYGVASYENAYDDAKLSSGAMMAVPSVMPAVNGSRNAEKYERTGYSASYETRRFDQTCDVIEGLKPLDYVLFDSANRSERSCWYQFRVESDKSEEVLAKLKELKPADLSVDVQSVAQSIENSADRIEALKRQRAAIVATLAQAEAAYDDAIRAVRGTGVGSLGALVTDKLATIERLTNSRLSLDERISALEEGKKDTIDDTTYAHFSVSVARVVVVDWESIGDAWRYAFARAISDVSGALTDILFGIPVIALRALWLFVIALAGVALLVLFAQLARGIIRRIWLTS